MARQKSTDRLINYNLRPAKAIERKVMIEFLKEICPPKESSNYQYIGFGASFYFDFKLIHSELNISTMISIEGDDSPDNQTRCQFNEPYKCITTIFDKSYNVLPGLDWNKKSIVWLDYDKPMEPYMLEDIQTCCQTAKSGNILILSLRADGFDNYTKDEFHEQFEGYSPSNLINEDLQDNTVYKTIYKVFKAKIDETLSNSNSSTPEETKLTYTQLFYFKYSDGAPMLTLGLLFHLVSETQAVSEMHFNSHSYFNPTDETIILSTPIITNKEFHELRKLLPSNKTEFIENPDIQFIPEKHRKNFYYNYRYYPKYIEINDL